MKRISARLWLKAKRWRYWIEAQAAMALIAVARLFPADRTVSALDALGRRIGPLTPRHKVALQNLRNAYPEKSEAEREAIARGMWGNMFRLAAEYLYLDQLIDYEPGSDVTGRVEVKGEEIFDYLHQNRISCIFFTAHTGNFELLPIAAAMYGLEVTVLFRPPNNPYIAEKLLGARRTAMDNLVPSQAGAVWGLAKALNEGRSVGALVDQKFHRGPRGTFFGGRARTNPLIPKLARQFDRPVYPARCIRLPGGRFRVEIEPEIKLPRDDKGEIDVAASTQLLNDVVERWVREYPDQWMWFHRRWDQWTKPDEEAAATAT